ncbi:MAG: beta-ketoacyl-[acyl-carrier-protein] synthase II [Candidatus Zixiibacteriota bacterium]|nr:MAG: beta-ketoacyl-[acyl-carrier-protein] synthase II [candidate division Zixibacteria bacterium]
MRSRVVVTGFGVVSPVGNTVDEFWNSLLEGKSGVGSITRFDTSAYPTTIAAEVKNLDTSAFIEKKELRRMDTSEQYAVAASEQAIKDSGLDLETLDLDKCGVVIGSGIGGIGTFEKQHSLLEKSGPGRVSPFFIPMMIIDMCAGYVSIKYGFRGPNYATVSACASSAQAIANAMHIIQRGEADVMIAGGSEAAITPTALAGFCQAKAISRRNNEPERASRPFDIDRDGFVMGEGSAIVVLESYEHAKARGARIYGEVLGAGSTADAYHVTAPVPDGHGARRAMEMALKAAAIEPKQVNYINTHGTATPLGDISETKAIKQVFGQRASEIPCNSTKSMIGHMLGSAGAIELITVFKSIENKIVHRTINVDNPDPECDLDYVTEGNRKCDIRYAISNSFGFGGHNVSLIVGRIDDDL